MQFYGVSSMLKRWEHKKEIHLGGFSSGEHLLEYNTYDATTGN